MGQLKSAQECYRELKEKKMSVEEFQAVMNVVSDIKEFSIKFIEIVQTDIAGNHKNLDKIIEALKVLLQDKDISDELKKKIIDSLTEIAREIQKKQLSEPGKLAILAILAALLAYIVKALVEVITGKNK